MQAGVLLQRGMSGRFGASGQEGLLFSGGWDTCCLCHWLLAPQLPTPSRALQVGMNLPEVTSPGDRQLQLAATCRAGLMQKRRERHKKIVLGVAGNVEALICTFSMRTCLCQGHHRIWQRSGKQSTAWVLDFKIPQQQGTPHWSC